MLILLLPFPTLSPQAHSLAAVSCLVIVYWFTEAIPIPATALLGVALAVLLGVAPAGKILTAFGDPVIFLFIGSFMLARAMEFHGVDKRIAYTLLAHPWVGGSTYRTMWALGLTSWLLSMWISNTAAVAMLFPVALAMARGTERLIRSGTQNSNEQVRLRYTKALLLMLAFSGSVGGLATPVGTPPNLIGIALIDEGVGLRIGFFQWMLLGLPLATTMLAVVYFVLVLFFRPEVKTVPGQPAQMREALRGLGPWTAGQRNSLAAFTVAVFLWIAPGFLQLILGAEHPFTTSLGQRLPEGVGALLAASLLFLLPTDWRQRQFTLDWEEAAHIDWGTVLLFGAGIALGRMLFETGLAGVLSDQLLSTFGVASPAAITGAAALTAVVISETSSNTASASTVVPVMIAVGKNIGSGSVSLALAATMGASLGFMLPVSTPPNAIVYGSKAIRITEMIRAGILVDLIGVVLVWAIAYWLAPWVLGMR